MTEARLSWLCARTILLWKKAVSNCDAGLRLSGTGWCQATCRARFDQFFLISPSCIRHDLFADHGKLLAVSVHANCTEIVRTASSPTLVCTHSRETGEAHQLQLSVSRDPAMILGTSLGCQDFGRDDRLCCCGVQCSLRIIRASPEMLK